MLLAGDATRRYDEEFYRGREKNRQAAQVILPLLMELVKPDSAIDIGCATGIWLSVLKELGVREIRGVDGDWVPRHLLEIPAGDFTVADLRQPYIPDRRYDLAMSMEVAEHLPPECAGDFVDVLTRLAPVVLFSAAIPFQGGVNHVNEQWPDYWAELFRARGFLPIDCIRPRVWNTPEVVDHSYHFAQNLLLFAHEQRIAEDAALRREFEATVPSRLSVVHPKFFVDRADPGNITLDPSRPEEYRSLSLGMVLPLLLPLGLKALARRLGGRPAPTRRNHP